MRGLQTNLSRLLVLALCHLVAVQPILGQQGLRIEVVEGSGAKNTVQQIAARPISVRVEDAGGRPVIDAAVTFTSPQQGPSGEFSNDLRTLSVTTDSRGIATADRYHPNALTGTYNIEIKAEFGGQTATAIVPQQNVSKGKGHGKLIAILVVIVAAGGAIAASSLKKKGSSSSTTGPTITLGGTSTVGAPTP
jgi:hypothetical protein